MNIKLASISLLLGVALTACGGSGGEGCPSGWFSCADGLACVEPGLVCDQRDDCADGSDELNCGGCSLDEWECTNQQCVLTTQVCDGANDCDDGSDEGSCNCDPFTEFECNDGPCIDIALRCDETEDCSDGSDEEGCPCNPSTEFECNDSTCIDIALQCDGNDDCGDGSDELGCNCNPITEFECSDETCIDSALRCDGNDDCGDGSDEEGCICDPLSANQCNPGEKCGAWYDTADFGDPGFRCVPDGTRQVNETCELVQQPGGFADTCSDGGLCMPTPDGGAFCFGICDPQGSGSECTIDQPTCAQPYAGDPVGICIYCSGEYVTQEKTQETRLYYDNSHNQELAPGLGMQVFVQIAGAANIDVSNITDGIRKVCLSDCDILFISTPKTTFSQEEKTAVIDYLNEGGRVLFTIDDDVHSDLSQSEANDILAPFGLSFGNLTGLDTGAFTYAGTAVTPTQRNITYIFGRVVSGGTPFIEINASGGLISGAYAEIGVTGRIVVVSENTPFIDAFINQQDNAAFTDDVLQWLLN